MLARGGIDALNPKGAKLPLANAPIAVRVLKALLDLLDRDAKRTVATTAESFRGFDDLAVTGVRCDAPFNACHGAALTVLDETFDDLCVLRAQNRRAALLADLLVGPLDHAMLFIGLIGTNLARTGKAEALFGATFRL